MKSSLNMVKDGYNTLNKVELTSIITGDLHYLERPKNSKLEDIVVVGLPISADQLQQGVFCVNIHIPNLKVKIAGNYDETQPNFDRLNMLGDFVIGMLQDVTGYDYHFNVSSPGYPIKDSDGTWFLNIRVNYYAVQPNYSII